MIEKAVYSRASGHAGLGGLVGTRIYHEVVDQDAAYPNVVYSRVSTLRHPAMGANAAVSVSRIQFNCYGDTALQALEVSEQVRAAFSRWRGTEAGVVVQASFDEGLNTDYDADIGKHRAIVEFMMWYEES